MIRYLWAALQGHCWIGGRREAWILIWDQIFKGHLPADDLIYDIATYV